MTPVQTLLGLGSQVNRVHPRPNLLLGHSIWSTKDLLMGLLVLLLQSGGQLKASEPVFLVPLRVHLLSSETSDWARCRLSPGQASAMVTGANQIWASSGIRFEVERTLQEPAREAGPRPPSKRGLLELIPRSSFLDSAFNIYVLHEMEGNGIILPHGRLPVVFIKDSARLRTVPEGVSNPLARVLAHELGHALGLSHRQNVYNLMASGTTGASLNQQETDTARINASTVLWIGRAGPEGDEETSQ